MNIDLTIAELHRMFDFFNERFYEGLLQRPVLLIQTNGRHKYALGWCTTKKIWNDQEGNESYYEITICAEWLDRSIEEMIGTLLHEMVHLHNLQYGIKDVSRGNTYHNKRFKAVAEEKGLIISYDKRIGWSITTLQESTKTMISELAPNLELFRVARKFPVQKADPENESGSDDGSEDQPKKPKSSSRKYKCPSCSTIIRATKDVNVICGDCEVSFELEIK